MNTYTLIVKDGRKIIVRMVGVSWAEAIAALGKAAQEIGSTQNAIIDLRATGFVKDAVL